MTIALVFELDSHQIASPGESDKLIEVVIDGASCISTLGDFSMNKVEVKLAALQYDRSCVPRGLYVEHLPVGFVAIEQQSDIQVKDDQRLI